VQDLDDADLLRRRRARNFFHAGATVIGQGTAWILVFRLGFAVSDEKKVHGK
jgi:hypothetical protein